MTALTHCTPELSQIAALARAVARLGTEAMLINPDNECAGWASIDSAVAGGETFAVKVAEDIVAIDCDDIAAVPHLHSIAHELKDSGLDPVVVNSGQRDHLHLFCRVEDFHLLAGCKNRARATEGLDVREGGRRIRPPLSPHRSGCPVSLATSHTSAQALRALGRKPSIPKTPTAIMVACLAGKNTGRDKTRSALLISFARSARANGWGEWEAYHRALTGDRMAERLGEEKEPRQYWHRHVWNHTGYNPIRDQHAVVETIENLRGAYAASCEGGRVGRARLRAFEAHCLVATRACSLRYGLSDRELSELMGVSLPTAQKHNRWLVSGGYVVRDERGMGRRASVYRLSERILTTKSFTGYPPEEVPVEIDLVTRIVPTHDAWHHNALGETGQLIFSVLDDEEAKSVAEIHFAARCSRATVYRRLALFEDLGLATRVDGMWIRNPFADLDHAALILGAAGRGLARKELHAAQRSYYQERGRHAPSNTSADVQRHHAPGEGDGRDGSARVLHLGAPRDRDESHEGRGGVLASAGGA